MCLCKLMITIMTNRGRQDVSPCSPQIWDIDGTCVYRFMYMYTTGHHALITLQALVVTTLVLTSVFIYWQTWVYNTHSSCSLYLLTDPYNRPWTYMIYMSMNRHSSCSLCLHGLYIVWSTNGSRRSI